MNVKRTVQYMASLMTSGAGFWAIANGFNQEAGAITVQSSIGVFAALTGTVCLAFAMTSSQQHVKPDAPKHNAPAP